MLCRNKALWSIVASNAIYISTWGPPHNYGENDCRGFASPLSRSCSLPLPKKFQCSSKNVQIFLYFLSRYLFRFDQIFSFGKQPFTKRKRTESTKYKNTELMLKMTRHFFQKKIKPIFSVHRDRFHYELKLVKEFCTYLTLCNEIE